MTSTFHKLAESPFSQDWSNTDLITVDDNWDGVPSIIGYRGDDLTTSVGTDPQTILADGTNTPIDVNANETDPNTFISGGVAEFEIENPVVALNGSGTADAPFLLISLDATGVTNVNVSYNLRDLDSSSDNSVQQIALQYRLGTSGDFTNIPAAYVPDASTGPNLATLVTPISVQLPSDVTNQPEVQVRVIGVNGPSTDEWIGVDDILITASPITTAGVTVAESEGTTVVNEEGATTDTYTIGLNTTPSGPVTVAISANDGQTLVSADGTNFANSATVTLTDTTTQTITVQAVDDGTLESSPHTGLITHSIVSSGDPAYSNASTPLPDINVSILDNDADGVRIRDIQGTGHISPLLASASGRTGVTNVPGIVTAIASNGFYIQDPTPDNDVATSEGIFVFTGSGSSVLANRTVGEAVLVTGTVTEFRPGGSTNLTITEILNDNNVLPLSVTPWATAPTTTINPVVIPTDRTPPTSIINDDFTTPGDVETGGDFDPINEGIDFYESLEGMLVQVIDPLAVSPTEGSFWVVANNGVGATGLNPRGGITISEGDFNPERIQIVDDLTSPLPVVNVGARLNDITGVVSYSSTNYELLATAPVTVETPSSLQREVTNLVGTANQLTIGNYNVENLDALDGERFNGIASIIVNNLKSPDIIALQEIQDNNGPVNDSVVSADVTLQTLADAVAAAGGPTYKFLEVPPLDDTNGGQGGGNIRVAYLYNPERVDFVERPGADSTVGTTVIDVNGTAQLSFNPGLIDPLNPAFNSGTPGFSASRKPLVGEFVFNGQSVFLINNHFTAGTDSAFGRFQPPENDNEIQRTRQSQEVGEFVQEILAVDPNANVVVLGDLNSFQFFPTLTTLEGFGLTNLTETLPETERYTFNNSQGNSIALDHILVNNNLFQGFAGYDVVHVNAEFADQVSDHEPAVALFNLSQSVVNGGPGRDTLIGTSQGDLITGLQGRDTITTGAGYDRIVYTGFGDGGDVITDFTVGLDKLDFSQLLDQVVRGGYSGTNAIADGYLGFRQDGANSVVLFDPNGRGPDPARAFVTLENVAIADLNNANNFVF